MYYVFVGDNYYPGGGWRDFKGSFSNLDDCWKCIINTSGDWYQIVRNDEVIDEGNKR